MRIIFLSFALLAIAFMFSCKKDKIEEPPDLGYDYAPTTIGKYVIYDVDSTVYDENFHDTIYYKYRIKEKLEENFTDNEGRPAVKLVRYMKKYNPAISYDNMAWTIKDVWMANKTKTTYEVVEEDVRFTKLIFPVRADAEWNGNAHNTLGEWDYNYKYIDTKENINGTLFENVLYVKQKDDEHKNNIHREYYIEKYAKNVGLVYREIKDLISGTVTISNGQITPVESRITSGITYKLNYITHGYE